MMKKTFLTLFIFLIAFGVFLPNLSPASAALVPCGGTGQDDCNLCHAFQLINNVFDFVLTTIVPSVLIIMIIWGGITLLTSGGNQESVKKGRKIITSAIIGAIIVYAALIIVGTVLGIVVEQSSVKGFFKFENGTIEIQCGV